MIIGPTHKEGYRMQVKVTFQKAPYSSWIQVAYNDVDNTEDDGDYFQVTFNDDSTVCFPKENIFSIEESDARVIKFEDSFNETFEQ
jgi:hypothetical protein